MAQKKTQRYERERGRRQTTREAVTGVPSTSYDDPGVLEEAEPMRSEPVRAHAAISRNDETPPHGRVARMARSVGNALRRAKNKLT